MIVRLFNIHTMEEVCSKRCASGDEVRYFIYWIKARPSVYDNVCWQISVN